MSAVLAAPELLDGDRLAQALRAGIHRLLSQQEHLNKINVFPVPDGDTGTNLALTMSAVLAQIRRESSRHAGQLLTRVADAALDGARGNSGAILAQFFLGVGDKAGHLATLSATEFADAVGGGAAYARESLAEPREGTILTVLTDVAAELRAQAGAGVADFPHLLERALQRARQSVERTRTQLDSLRKADVVDAGAQGFVEILEGMSHYLRTGEVASDDAIVVVHDEAAAAGTEQDLTHRWCTECMVTGTQIEVRALRERLAALGSSLVVAGTASKVKVHVHVNDPGEVFRLAESFGQVSGQKADDMQRQQEAAHHRRRQQVAIVTDSAADLPDEALERLDINLVPVRLHFGEHSYLDKVSLTPEQFYAELASNPHHPKTSQPPPGDFRRAFEFLGSHFDSVVYIGVTSRASGTMQSAESAANRLQSRSRVITIDSRNASLGQGLLVMHAAELAASGADAATIIAAVEAMRSRTRTFACLATLDYGVRGGRVPAWARTVATWLRLTPLLATKPDGHVSIGGVLLGRTELPGKFARWVASKLEAGKRYRIGIGHANAPAQAAQLQQRLRALGGEQIVSDFVVPNGSALGVHGGPGMLVVGLQELSDADLARLGREPDGTR